MANMVVAFQKKTRTKEMGKMQRLVTGIIRIHEKAGFQYQDTTPIIKFGMPEGSGPFASIYTKVLFSKNERTLYFNLDAMKEKERIDSLENPILQALTQRIPRSAGSFFEPTSETELNSLVSYGLGQYWLNFVAKNIFPDSWLFAENKCLLTENWPRYVNHGWLFANSVDVHKEFAQLFMKGGISEYFSWMFTRCRDNIADEVWTLYSGDFGILSEARSWFITKASQGITGPIMEKYGFEGLRYILKNPLEFVPFLNLSSAPIYLARAQKTLSAAR